MKKKWVNLENYTWGQRPDNIKTTNMKAFWIESEKEIYYGEL